MTRPHRCQHKSGSRTALSRLVVCLAVLALVAGCSSSGPRTSASDSAARYAARARGNYIPPGPPGDPWGPYIRKAATRFDVPETWVRSVMRVESGGKEYLNGKLITSSAGAMGLMQVMPDTYSELRDRHNLGDDPYDPQDNILAGTAYLREMYDIYGSPGFLAAYNAGPRRLDDYLSNNRPLPDETRRYVAMIGPNITGVYPASRSPAESYAMNALPIEIPPGTRYGRTTQFASRGNGRTQPREPVQVAQLPEPPRPVARQAPQQLALVSPPPAPPSAPRTGFRLIPAAVAEPIPMRHSGAAGGQWAIQVGAYSTETLAQAALGNARGHAKTELAVARNYVGGVHQGRTVLYRARLTGMSRETAVQACERISHGRMSCVVLSPDAQS